MKPTPVKPVRLVDVSDVGRVAENPRRKKRMPAIKPDVPAENIPVLGSRRTRKLWKELHTALSAITNFHDWLSCLYDLMLTPQFAEVKYTRYSSKTGKPVDFSWVPAVNSASRQFVYHGQHDHKLHIEIVEELDLLLKELEKSKLPVLYSTGYKDSSDTIRVRRVVVYRDYIPIGGGHNDSASYVHALVFAPVVEEYEVLSGD